MSKEIFIHTGMPKCGSTYLQEEIFPNLKELYFTHLQLYPTCPIAMFLKEAVYANPLIYERLLEVKEANEFIEGLDVNKLLISWEGLYGDCFNNSMNSLFINNLLKETYPRPKL